MSRKVFNPVWFLALFLVFCLSFAPDGWGGWRGHGHDRDIRGDGADVHAAAPGSPVILDFWIDKINLGPAMATVYGGSVLADADTRVFDPDGLADIESVTIRTSGIPRDFSLYDDGTHGDFYSHDGEYSLRPFLNPPTGDYTFTATDRSGQTYQRMTALNDNNMPPPL